MPQAIVIDEVRQLLAAGRGARPEKARRRGPSRRRGIPYRTDAERALEALDEDLAWPGDGAGGDPVRVADEGPSSAQQ
jgi:hypothetical protein